MGLLNNRYTVIDAAARKHLASLSLTSAANTIINTPDKASQELANVFAERYPLAERQVIKIDPEQAQDFVQTTEDTHKSSFVFVIAPANLCKAFAAVLDFKGHNVVLAVDGVELAASYPKQKVELLTEKDAQRYYDEIYPQMLYEWQKAYTNDFREKFIGEQQGKTILDLGCANGNVIKNYTDNNDVYGVDIAAELVEGAREKGVNASVCNLDTQPLPYDDDMFDVIVGFDIFEHLFHQEKAITELFRVLKPGGVLKASVPILHDERYAGMAYFLNKTATDLSITDKLAMVVPDAVIKPYDGTIKAFTDAGFTFAHAEGWEWPWKNTPAERVEFLRQNPSAADDVFAEFTKD